MSNPPPSPSDFFETRSQVFEGYLDYFRSRIVDKVSQLSALQQRTSRLASGWTPVELIKHLTYVELRWLEWGFEGRDVGDPWGDRRDDHWFVDESESLAALVAAFDERAERSRHIIEQHELTEIGQPGPRWDGGDPPTLERILFHLLGEYARHLGHLDIVCEFFDDSHGQ
ncbi:MAG: DUF664 domain-containing protein [Acidimicrobiales bacterium]